jgi:hypothetical protein
MKSCTSNGDKAPSEEMLSEFLEVIGSVAMVVPADYT